MKIFCKDIPGVKWEKPGAYSITNSVHVWKTEVNKDPKIIEDLKKNLDDDELRRAGRFAFEKDRDQFITAHGRVRSILSKYIGVRPKQIQFKRTATRKPYIHFPTTFLKFNISHSEKLILIALSDCEIGVDVEKVKDSFEFKELSKTYFSNHEQREIASFPFPKEMFYKLWTRKEAALKASGNGITENLKNIQVAELQNESPFDDNIFICSWKIENFFASVATVGKSIKTEFIKA